MASDATTSSAQPPQPDTDLEDGVVSLLRQTGIIVEALGQDKAGAEPLKALCDQYLESVAELQTSFEQQITKFEDQSTSVSSSGSLRGNELDMQLASQANVLASNRVAALLKDTELHVASNEDQ